MSDIRYQRNLLPFPLAVKVLCFSVETPFSRQEPSAAVLRMLGQLPSGIHRCSYQQSGSSIPRGLYQLSLFYRYDLNPLISYEPVGSCKGLWTQIKNVCCIGWAG